MIVTASRRTDIPAFYSEWFVNRLKEGYALVPNPRNPQRVGRVELSPKIVDCVVFWTKNPFPMFGRLKEIEQRGYPFITHFTLTPYDGAVECGLPPKAKLLDTLIELADRTSPDRVVWRYDPVIVDGRFSVDWHLERFARMCERLSTHVHRCIVSFVEPYKSIEKDFRAMTHKEMTDIAIGFSQVAQIHNIGLSTCAEEVDLSEYGISNGACVGKKHIEQVIGSRLEVAIDANQREACLCAAAVDVGAYDTCPHGCAYCYAVSSRKTALRRMAAHNPTAPMITGHPTGTEIVTNRTTKSHKVKQLYLF